MKRHWCSVRSVGLIVGVCIIMALMGCQKKEQWAAGPDLYPAYVTTAEGMQWGYVDHQGKFVIQPQFSKANDFQANGLAIVQVDDAFGVINQKGEFVIEANYEEIRPFMDGVSYARSGETIILDEKGNSLFSTKEWIGEFSDGLAVFMVRAETGEDQYGYLDLSGKVKIQPQYVYATPFYEGKAIVKRKDKDYLMIRPDGTILQEFSYSNMGEVSENRIAFQDDTGKWGYVDEKGQVVVEPQFDTAGLFENGVAIVNEDFFAGVNMGVIRNDGSFVLQPEYSRIQRMSNGMLAIGKPIRPEEAFIGAKYAMAKEDGTILTDFLYYEVNEFYNGLASVSDRDSTFFIDESGQPSKDLPRVPGLGTLMYDGRVIKAVIDQETFYLNRQGDIIWEPITDVALTNGVTVVKTKHRPNRNILTYYPQLTGLQDAAVQDTVNQRLKKVYTKVTASADEDLYYNYTGDYLLQYAVGNLLVLGLSGYNYPFGAAHGAPVQEYFHIDLASGQFYELQDLFKPGTDYVTRINDVIQAQIPQVGEKMGLFSGEGIGIKTNQPWILSQDALHIYFGVYEIAPYAAGFPKFTIPYEEIMDLIDLNGSLWTSMQP